MRVLVRQVAKQLPVDVYLQRGKLLPIGLSLRKDRLSDTVRCWGAASLAVVLRGAVLWCTDCVVLSLLGLCNAVVV